ncbi:M4 family metallopeptidase [Streptomyces sp. N2-109]|uniref:Neutral metalloproteinase n=1 Tax=Streptomyces gossypii TaxID=2883101 RepID=A0ABT2JX71_9ACTN|nr:M4 family metallopeptidase [Streptomyces gossypii]MCT2592498.1 M4 family metallopeptidase [Streptomyces gossypii]
MRSTSPRRANKRARAAGALIATAAMVAVGVQANTASAAPEASKANPGALPAKVTPQQKAALLQKAEQKQDATAKALDLGGKSELRVRDVVKNKDGATHTRYEQTYDGLPVLGGEVIVHRTPEGAVDGVDKAVETKISVPTTKASADAKPKTPAAKDSKAPRKVIWAADGKPTLAWEKVVGGKQKDGTPNELHVITDAKTGDKLYEYQGVHNGTGNSQYSGTVGIDTSGSSGSYRMEDSVRGGHETRNSDTGAVFTDADDVWGNGLPSNVQTAGVDAHYGAALTWDYYKDVHQRNGIRNDGVGATSNVHYGNAYQNAFWQDSCFCMTYGDGANNEHPLTSIDVAAHEMTHGVTSNTARLVYSRESGGLNEATSDIFAAAVEFHANNPEDVGDYMVGEKVDLFGNGDPLRYMDEPSKDGSSLDNWYSGAGNVDVHYSSGIANHFFYLVSEGSGQKVINGVSYDSPTYDNQPVTGIGINAAEKIWFKALTEKMHSNETFADARADTLEAAAELYGADSPEQLAVANAWAAVNVGDRPGDPGEPGGDEFENTDNVNIPDAGAAVTSSIAVTGVSGNAPSDLKVSVDIKHSYRGDLVLDLVAPDGTLYRLKNSNGDSANNVLETYTKNASSETANGTWKLRAQDVYRADTGYIDSWKLTF